MADFACTLQINAVEGLPADVLTVGRVFTLSCRGPWPQGLDPAKLSVVGLPEGQRPLKILGAAAVDKDTVAFRATSYTPGQVKFETLGVGDGTTTLDLGPLEFTVQSVIEQTSAKQEPYGPLGPFELSVPPLWYAVPVAFVALLALAIAWQVRRRVQRRRLLRKLDERQSALSPLGEFHQRLRRLRRESGIFSGTGAPAGEAARVAAETENIVRVYLTRRFRLPALDWNDGTLVRTFRRENRALFAERGPEFARLLREFGEARAVKELAAADAVQLANDAAKLIEALDRLQSETDKGRSR